MREILVIRISPSDPGLADWQSVDRLGNLIGPAGHGTLSEAAAKMSAECMAYVLVPGEELVLTEVVLPARRRQQFLQALPFALEEQLADDVEDLHFAAGDRNRDGSVGVASVAHATLASWLDALDRAGIVPTALIPDCLALPWQSDAPSALVESGRVSLRTAHAGGLVARPSELGVLDIGFDDGVRMQVHDAGAGDDLVLVEAALSAAGVDIETSRTETPVIATLARGVCAGIPLNLLQGSYSSRKARVDSWQHWRTAAALLAGVLLLEIGMSTADLMQLRAEERSVKSELLAHCAGVFSEMDCLRLVDTPEDLVARLSRAAGDAGAGAADRGGTTRLLNLLDALHIGMDAAAGATLRGLNFRDGMLDVRVNARDVQALEDMRHALERHGAVVELSGIEATADRVQARIAIRAGAPG